MTPTAQRIAIAEAYGLAKEVAYFQERRTTLSLDSVIPDYLNDLNAMHEAEEVLSRTQQQSYVQHLADLTDCNIQHDIGGWGDMIVFPLLSATASHRAEAFLQTIGKWDDSK